MEVIIQRDYEQMSKTAAQIHRIQRAGEFPELADAAQNAVQIDYRR